MLNNKKKTKKTRNASQKSFCLNRNENCPCNTLFALPKEAFGFFVFTCFVCFICELLTNEGYDLKALDNTKNYLCVCVGVYYSYKS